MVGVTDREGVMGLRASLTDGLYACYLTAHRLLLCGGDGGPERIMPIPYYLARPSRSRKARAHSSMIAKSRDFTLETSDQMQCGGQHAII